MHRYASDDTVNPLFGSVDANRLVTLGGNGLVFRVNGNDAIETGAGSAANVEIIAGGIGADTLTNCVSRDFFIYQSRFEGGDTITDIRTV